MFLYMFINKKVHQDSDRIFYITIAVTGQLPRGQFPLLVGQLPLRTITPLILICG